MNVVLDVRQLTPEQHAALIDEARRRAIEARREAAQQFWSALGRRLGRARLALRRRLVAADLRSRGLV